MKKTIYDQNIFAKIKEWLKWHDYFYWQYGLSKRYFKNMIYVGLLFLLPAKIQDAAKNIKKSRGD